MDIEKLFEFVVFCLALNVFNILIWFTIFYLNIKLISYFEEQIEDIKKKLQKL